MLDNCRTGKGFDTRDLSPCFVLRGLALLCFRDTDRCAGGLRGFAVKPVDCCIVVVETSSQGGCMEVFILSLQSSPAKGTQAEEVQAEVLYGPLM